MVITRNIEQRQIQGMFGQLDHFDSADVRPACLCETIRLLDSVSATRRSFGLVVVTVPEPAGPDALTNNQVRCCFRVGAAKTR
jgi:hypothetical protein